MNEVLEEHRAEHDGLCFVDWGKSSQQAGIWVWYGRMNGIFSRWRNAGKGRFQVKVCPEERYEIEEENEQLFLIHIKVRDWILKEDAVSHEGNQEHARIGEPSTPPSNLPSTAQIF